MAVPNNQLSTETLFHQFAPEIRRFLMNRFADENSVDDILQITFLKLNEKLDSINPLTVRPWLYRVAINQANMAGRKQKSESKVWKHLVQTADLNSVSTEDTVLKKEGIEQMRVLLDALPENQRVIVRLKFYEGLTFAEIAKRIETPLGTVLSRMRSAIKSLEQICQRANLTDI